MEDGLLSCNPCPIELLAEVIRINNERSSAHHQIPLLCNEPATTSAQGLDPLVSIMAFCPIRWASRISSQISCAKLTRNETAASSSAASWDWARVARIYQGAAILYCISATPECSSADTSNDNNDIFRIYRSSLLEDLQTISTDEHSHLRKLVLWPLVILGLTLDHNDDFAQKYVISELKWESAALGIASPLVAKDLLGKIWLKGSGGRGTQWEELFDRPYVFGL